MKALKSLVFDSQTECHSSTEELRHEHRKKADAKRLKRDYRKKPEMISPREFPGT